LARLSLAIRTVPDNIFADTSGWATLFVQQEPFHAFACDMIFRLQAQGWRIYTSNYVLSELSALLMSPMRVHGQLRMSIRDRIRSAPWVEIVHIDEAIDQESWQLLFSRPDKEFSLVDCSSFAVMRRLALRTALTTDHHFEQAGFHRLLK
jgi:predicted nucleic acid-binding protein